MVKSKNIATVMMISLLLSACQLTTSNLPEAKDQQTQLSALIGASQFLREQCHRSDIQTDDKLIALALKEAEKKDWKVAVSHKQLLDESKNVVTQLSADSTALQEKCRGLNRTLTPFLTQFH